MRFVLATFGTRGETDPFLALAFQLQRRGHEVLLITTEEYESRARAFGIHVHCVPGSFKASLAPIFQRPIQIAGSICVNWQIMSHFRQLHGVVGL